MALPTHYEYLAEFLGRMFSRARAFIFLVSFVVAVVLYVTHKKEPSLLVLLVSVSALMEGAYSAYHHERANRASMAQLFGVVWSFRAESFQLDWAGPYLRGIRAQVVMWLQPNRDHVRVETFFLRLFHRRRSWRTLWLYRHRELLTNVEDFVNKPEDSWDLHPMADPTFATAKFRTEGEALRRGRGVKVEGDIEYELLAISSSPRGMVAAAPAASPISEP